MINTVNNYAAIYVMYFEAFGGLILMMICVRVFFWVYLDVSGALETSNDVQTLPDQHSQSPQCSQGVSPISISRLYQSTDFYGESSVFKKRKNLSQNLPEMINEDEEPQLNYEMSNQGKFSFFLQRVSFF